MNQREDELYQSLRKAIFLIVGLAILLWFVYEIRVIVLLFTFAFILAIVLNAPVTWLEGRRIRRGIATLAVASGVLIVVILFSWIVLPRLNREVVILVEELPNYTSQLVNYVSSLVGNYPALEAQLRLDGETVTGLIPSLPILLGRVGRYSFSFVGILALTLVLISVTVYTVLYARPILKVYVQLLPAHLREPGTRAFARATEMVIGWMWSNVIAGALDAIAVGIFLSLMGIPGALIWSALALFAELIPLLGIYLMAIPPVLVALSINPLTALWVALFYVVLNEIMGHFIMPRVRSTTMDIHPVFLLFVIVAMGSVFGLIGALSAAPLAAFAKAYYEEFYLARRRPDPDLDDRVEAMVSAGVAGAKREG